MDVISLTSILALLAPQKMKIKVILGWGSVGESNKRIADRQKEVLKLLKPFKEKLVTIADSKGRSGYHPLAPQIYAKWVLKPFEEKS